MTSTDKRHAMRLAGVVITALVVLSLGVGATSAAGAVPTGEPSDWSVATPPADLNTTVGNGTSSVSIDRRHHGYGNRWLSGGGSGIARPTATGNGAQTVVVSLRSVTPDRLETLRAHGVTVETIHGSRVQAEVPAGNRSAIRSLPWVRGVRTPYVATPQAVSEGVTSISADEVQDLGVTGENATVGVIDVGFDTSNPEIASNIAATRSFTGDLTNGGRDTHGTAVSEIVVDTAPDAELYLANIRTGVQFANAVEWLVANDVDVITLSLGFPGQPQDGSGLVARAVTSATEQGVVVTTSAGNSARTHWEGRGIDADGDGWVEVSEEFETNAIAGAGTYSGRVHVTMVWDDWPRSDQDYDLYLVRSSTDEVVASSTATQSPDLPSAPVETIRGRVPADTYYVAIAAHDVSRPATVEVFLNDRAGPLEFDNATSSLMPPATAPGATTVGAYGAGSGDIESFTSEGPTGDGRVGVDLVGPSGVTTTAYASSFAGTSASAPHVGGLAALLRSDNPGLAPDGIERALETSATDIAPPGVDPRSGHGRPDAVAALRAASPDPVVTGVTLETTTADVGTRINGTITVENTAAVPQTVSLTLTVDSVAGETITRTVDGRVATEIGFNVTFETAGVHTVGVNDFQSTEVTVTRQGDPLAVYANEDGIVTARGLLDAAADFRNGTIGASVLLDAAAAFRSGDPVA